VSVATEATRGDSEKIPRIVKVKDSDGGDTIYIRSETKVARPADFAELKYDGFHPISSSLERRTVRYCFTGPTDGHGPR
jgi:hypothetical protein